MSSYRLCAEPGHKGQIENTISLNTTDFGFHSVTGVNIVIFEQGHYARRVNPDYLPGSNGCMVYSAVSINHCGTFMFEVVIAEYNDRESRESIRVGVMRRPSGTELKQSDVPRLSSGCANHCVWRNFEVWNMLSGELITTDYGLIGLHTLQEGDRVGVQLLSNGDLSFFVNDVNQGVAARGVLKEGYSVYPS